MRNDFISLPVKSRTTNHLSDIGMVLVMTVPAAALMSLSVAGVDPDLFEKIQRRKVGSMELL